MWETVESKSVLCVLLVTRFIAEEQWNLLRQEHGLDISGNKVQEKYGTDIVFREISGGSR